MTSYTNVTIPDQFGRDPSHMSREEVELMIAKIKYLENKNKELLDILNNIPVAVIDHGYVVLSYDLNKSIRLVKVCDNEINKNNKKR